MFVASMFLKVPWPNKNSTTFRSGCAPRRARSSGEVKFGKKSCCVKMTRFKCLQMLLVWLLIFTDVLQLLTLYLCVYVYIHIFSHVKKYISVCVFFWYIKIEVKYCSHKSMIAISTSHLMSSSSG